MKTNNLVLALCFGFLFSCNSKKENKATDKSIEKDSLVPLPRTVLADLTDSLQPKTYFLKDMPKPVVRAVPKVGGEITMLPVLKNEKGEPILDQDGNTILMGDGGLSNFTTFTSDDGLALDAFLCSTMDKFGNLWFGTKGGGVSRYDGKSFTNFTKAHGLANSAVMDIMEDNAGNLWFGTEGGVSLYNGQTFTNFTTAHGLAHNSVWSILEDKVGNYWFGTFGGGVSRYDPSASLRIGSKSFTNFSTDQGLAHNYVLGITEDRTGNLWFGTYGGGVSRFDPSASLRTGSISFTNFTTAQGLVNNNVLTITKDKIGNLWFGTGDGGVSLYDPSKSLMTESKSPKERQEVFTNFTTDHRLANNIVTSITEDNNVPTGEVGIWIGTSVGGVIYFDGNYFKKFTTAQGLPNNSVWSITQDKNGNLWVGTDSGGVSRYDGKSFTNFTKALGLAINAFTIMEDKTGNLWFGTQFGGVSRFDGKSFINFTSDEWFAKYPVLSILEDKAGNLWFGGGGVLSKYDGKFFKNYSTDQGLGNDVVFSIAEDKSGNLWFGTKGGGVSRFDGKSFTNFTTAQGLAHNEVMIITEDKTGNLWIGTTGGGVSCYDGKTFTNFSTAHGLANNYVNSIVEDKSGNLWFGTEAGVSFLARDSYKELFQEKVNWGDSVSYPNPKSKQVQVLNETTDRISCPDSISATLFKNFGTTDGLPDNFVTQVLQMPNGKMAVGTNFGITIFNISKDYSEVTDLEIFNSSTGYPVKDVTIMTLDSKGIIWAGTGSDKTGLVRFDYEALNRSVVLPTVVIQSIKVKDENISWHTLKESIDSVETRNSIQKFEMVNSEDGITIPAYITEEVSLFGRELRLAERDSMMQRFGKIEFDSITPFYPIPQNLVLPYNLNQVSIEFVAIETSRPQMVKYQYQLEGYNEDWSPVTNRSNASFGNIHEGTYTFKLKAQGANGIWTEPVTYTFRVLPPWYRTWWAYGLYFLFLAGLVWRIHLIQTEKTIRIEREKTKDRELAQAKEIEKAYGELGKAHETLKSTQAQLIQSEKMASLGELTAGIAHEIQNPLNFVNNFSEVSAELVEEIEEERAKSQEARDETLVSEILGDIKENLEKINHHGKRADAIVKGMLEHSRSGSGVKESTNLNTLAKEYVNLAYQGFKAKNKDVEIKLETDFDSSLSKIEIVRSDIGKVLLNILNNAFYACSHKDLSGFKPLVSVSTKLREGSPSGLSRDLGRSGGSERKWVQISISDNGPGIPDSIKDKIFQPFFTTKPTGQGTGLGLSLSYDIVKAHGGEIKVESEEGKGTTFIIQLPNA